MYICVGSMILDLSVGVLLGVSIGDGTRWEAQITVGMVPKGETVVSLSDYNDGRGKLEL